MFSRLVRGYVAKTFLVVHSLKSGHGNHQVHSWILTKLKLSKIIHVDECKHFGQQKTICKHIFATTTIHCKYYSTMSSYTYGHRTICPQNKRTYTNQYLPTQVHSSRQVTFELLTPTTHSFPCCLQSITFLTLPEIFSFLFTPRSLFNRYCRATK